MSSRLVSCALNNLTRRVGGLSLAAGNGGSSVVKTRQGALCGSLSASYSTAMSGSCRLLGGLPKATAPSLTASHLAATTTKTNAVLPALGLLNTMEGPFWQVSRSVTRKKRLERRRKRKEAARKAAKLGEAAPEEAAEAVAAPQHEAWVDFQRSISVKGFQTGQLTKARVQQKGEIGQKLKDHKRREKLEMRMAAKRPELADIRGGEYPTKRYSDEETERLLKMAYAALPPRAGKRGTRNLKRQKRRWFLVRKIHSKYKRQKIAAHYRLMEERSQRMKEIKAIKAEAPEIRARDRAYQRQVLRRWVQDLKAYNGDDVVDVIQAEATVVEDKV